MTREQFDELPKLNRTPKPYHFFGGDKAVSYVLNHEETEVGVVVGSGGHCQLAGCNGVKLYVRWPDGELTKPCTKGMSDVPGLTDVMKIG